VKTTRARNENHINQPRAKRGAGRSRVAQICTRLGSDTRGGAMLEMAISLPVVLLLMTGIFSFSIALYQKLQLAEAVSNGGRLLAVDRGDTDPCKTVATAIYAAAPGLTQSNMTLTFVLNGVSTGATCAGTAGAANSNMVAGGNAQVTATYPITIGVYGKNWGSYTLTTQITEVVQ
jgi:Flp pilus assembly protein TadG